MKEPRDQDRKDDRGDAEAEGSGRRVSPQLRDFAKRLMSTGAEAMHMTEEGLRNLVGDVSPREAVSGIFESVSKGTDTLQNVFVREARRYLDAINLRDELGKVLANYTIEVTAKVNFVPREKSTERKKGRHHADRDARLETEKLKIKLVPKEEGEAAGDDEGEGKKK